jgi:DNA repair exonuclease SbcCD ATPase subunit
MNKISLLSLNSVLYFKRAKVDLSKNSLTFIRGLNLDSDPANPTGNGAGKTLLFSAFPNLIYSSPPSAIKKKAKKELLSSKSCIAVEFQSFNGMYYRIEQYVSKFVIFESKRNTFDQKNDLHIRGIPNAEKFIKSIFPLTELDFYTTSYLTTQRPYVFQMDSDLNRLEHLSNICRLEHYDVVKRHFLEKLSTIKDTEIRLSVLHGKKDSVKVKLKNLDRVDLQTIVVLKEKIKECELSVHALIKEEQEIEDSLSSIKELKKVECELDILRKKYLFKEHPSKKLSILKKEKKISKLHDEYISLLSAYKKSISSIKFKLSSLTISKHSIKELKIFKTKCEEKLKSLDNSIEECNISLKQSVRLNKEIERIEKLQNTDRVISIKVDYSEELALHKASLKLEKLLEHEHKVTKCPTCLSDIDLVKISKIVKKAKDRIKILEESIVEQELAREKQYCLVELKKLKVNKKYFAELLYTRTLFNDKLKKIEKELRSTLEIQQLKKQLKSISKPKKLHPSSLGLSYSQIEEQVDLCNDILKHLEAKERLMSVVVTVSEFKSVDALNLVAKRIENRLETIRIHKRKTQSVLSERISKLEKYNQTKAERDLYEDDLTKLEKEIKKLTPQLEDKKIIEGLIRAYSSKGLKSHVANKICLVLEQNLNIYRNLIFMEPFQFSVQASDKGLSIRVDRGNGVISDVRNLSGAESNCFSLLFLISLLPLIPDSRRTNFVILDEPTSHSDTTSRELFLSTYLPALQEVVPNVYVITPHSEDFREGCSEWLIKKQGGKSTVIKV